MTLFILVNYKKYTPAVPSYATSIGMYVMWLLLFCSRLKILEIAFFVVIWQETVLAVD